MGGHSSVWRGDRPEESAMGGCQLAHLAVEPPHVRRRGDESRPHALVAVAVGSLYSRATLRMELAGSLC